MNNGYCVSVLLYFYVEQHLLSVVFVSYRKKIAIFFRQCPCAASLGCVSFFIKSFTRLYTCQKILADLLEVYLVL